MKLSSLFNGRVLSVLITAASLSAQGTPMSDFQDYFAHTPVIQECIASHQNGTNVIYYTRTIYDHGSFVTRTERTLGDLSKHTFTPFTVIAGRHDGQYWSWIGQLENKLECVDDFSISLTTNRFSAEIAAFGLAMGAAKEGLKGAFFGLPVWDPKSVSWSNNVLACESPSKLNLTATITLVTNNSPKEVEAITVQQKGFAFRSEGPWTNTLVYNYRQSGKYPSFVTILAADGTEYGWIKILKLKLSKRPISEDLFDYRTYLNSSVRNIRTIIGGKVTSLVYDDETQGKRRLLGLAIPNRYFFVTVAVLVAVLTLLIACVAKVMYGHSKTQGYSTN